MYEASCYFSENENKLGQITNLFHERLHFSIKGGGLNREGLGGVNKFLHLKRGGLLEKGAYMYLREGRGGGGLNRENTVFGQNC